MQWRNLLFIFTSHECHFFSIKKWNKQHYINTNLWFLEFHIFVKYTLIFWLLGSNLWCRYGIYSYLYWVKSVEMRDVGTPHHPPYYILSVPNRRIPSHGGILGRRGEGGTHTCHCVQSQMRSASGPMIVEISIFSRDLHQ